MQDDKPVPHFNLYRQEVYSKKVRLYGNVVVGEPVAWKAFGICLSLFVLASVATLFSVKYSERQTVSGWVVPRGGLVEVTARYGGIADTLLVAQGQIVRRGEKLASIRLSRDINSGDSGQLIEAASLAQVQAQKLANRAQNAQIIADIEQMKRKILLLQTQRSEIDKNIAYYQTANVLAQKTLERSQALNKQGYLSAKGLEDSHAAFLVSEQNLSTSKIAAMQLDQQIEDLQLQLAAKPNAAEQTKATAAATLASAESNLAEARANRSYDLNAPVDGAIGAINITPGQDLTTNGTAFILLPASQPLEVELFVPSSAIGLVQTGQRVALHYRAFPYEKFGSGSGRIVQISQSAMTPESVAPKGISVNEVVYKIRVQQDKNYVSAYGNQVPLKAGLLLDADIILSRQTLFEWLLQPINAVARR